MQIEGEKEKQLRRNFKGKRGKYYQILLWGSESGIWGSSRRFVYEGSFMIVARKR